MSYIFAYRTVLFLAILVASRLLPQPPSWPAAALVQGLVCTAVISVVQNQVLRFILALERYASQRKLDPASRKVLARIAVNARLRVGEALLTGAVSSGMVAILILTGHPVLACLLCASFAAWFAARLLSDRVAPRMLLLGSSRGQTGELKVELATAWRHRRVVSLLDQKQSRERISNALRPDDFRQLGDDWESSVRWLMRRVETIVVDGRATDESPYFDAEIAWIAEDRHASKVWVIIDSPQQTRVLLLLSSRLVTEDRGKLIVSSRRLIYDLLAQSLQMVKARGPTAGERCAALLLGVPWFSLKPPAFEPPLPRDQNPTRHQP